METIAIHESKDSEKVVQFININQLNAKAQAGLKNGDVVGLYYTAAGNVRYLDVWNQTHKAL